MPGGLLTTGVVKRYPAMRKPSIGDQELALLQHIDECSAASVGEVAASFGAKGRACLNASQLRY